MSALPQILIVDDEGYIQRLVRGVVMLSAGTPIVTHNGREALERLAAEPFDLIITDIFMPDMDGIELISHVRARWPKLPIIAISGGGAYGNTELLSVAKAMGATAVMSKPLAVSDLHHLIRDLLPQG